MKIAVLGATGTVGRATAEAARKAGHDVTELSRATGVDLHTGEGLDSALEGAEAVIDASNPYPTSQDADIVGIFAGVTERVAQASERAGVGQLVHLSISNIENTGFDTFDYYLAKRAQEEVLSGVSLPHSIIRSTQWMEFAMNPSAVVERADEVEVQDWLVQPIDVNAVAEVLVEAATGGPQAFDIAGPESIQLPELTRAWLAATGDSRTVTAVPASLPAFADGVLLPPEGARILGPTPSEWVARQGR